MRLLSHLEYTHTLKVVYLAWAAQKLAEIPSSASIFYALFCRMSNGDATLTCTKHEIKRNHYHSIVNITMKND